MTSIRFFLVILLMAVVTLGNFLAAMRGYWKSLEEAQLLFNEQLRQYISLLDYAVSKTGVAPSTINTNAFAIPTSSIAFQITDISGAVIAHSVNMPSESIAINKPGYYTRNLGGHRWHLYSQPATSGELWLTVGERDDLRFRVAESMALQAIYPMLLSVPIMGLIIWLVVGIGLRPIARLATQLHQREANDLTPISTDNMPRELKQLTLSVNSLLTRLEASFEREKRFSGDAAHELRTPIAAMQMHLENLIADWHTEQKLSEDTLHYLRRSVSRMFYLVEQILCLTRTAPDQYMARFESVNLQKLIRDTVSLNSPALTKKHHDITVSGSPCHLQADATALQTLLSNVLGNAIKYTPEYGKIEIRTDCDKHNVTIEISDNGPGIAPEQRQRIFDRFYRIGGDRHHSQTEGVGLGLAIVKQIVQLHKGRIEIEDSKFESGLTVRIFLPLTPYRT